MKFLRDKQFYYAIACGVLTGLIFAMYMLTIGIPKTQAANYYYLAKQQQGLGDFELAKKYFELSINSFSEDIVVEDYNQFSSDNYFSAR